MDHLKEICLIPPDVHIPRLAIVGELVQVFNHFADTSMISHKGFQHHRKDNNEQATTFGGCRSRLRRIATIFPMAETIKNKSASRPDPETDRLSELANEWKGPFRRFLCID